MYRRFAQLLLLSLLIKSSTAYILQRSIQDSGPSTITTKKVPHFVITSNSDSISLARNRVSRRQAKKYDDLQRSRALQNKVDKYIRMRDLKRDNNITQEYQFPKDDDDNDNSNQSEKGYKKFVGKGTLDQRLRAIIAYKREGAASDAAWSTFTANEEAELEELMEEDDYGDGQGLAEDDIDLIYEREITKILQTNALNDIQRGMMTDKELLGESNDSTVEFPPSNLSASSIEEREKEEAKATADKLADVDMYTPSRSSWGVFPRPRDISKTYGGGRVITREEVRKADMEWELEKLKDEQRAKERVRDAVKKENDNRDRLSAALLRARRCMQLGDRKGAVGQLEAVMEFANIQSELGGEVLLELAMAYETVERVEDARKLYGRLLTQSTNSKTRRNALGLIQGLDIVSRLRKDITRDTTPLMDYESMHSISMQLKEGLRNEWDDYKKKGVKVDRPWYDENDDATKRLESVQSVSDAYFLALRAMNPLKKIPSEALQRMFRKMYLANDTSKMDFINRGAPRRLNNSEQMSAAFQTAFNGSWELVLSLADKVPYAAKRFETGDVRVQALNRDSSFVETIPSLWGMFGSLDRYSAFSWDGSRREVKVITPEGRSESKIPGPKKSSSEQIFQITFVDGEVLLTRQAGAIGDCDIFTLWRRVKPTIWKKY